MWPLSVSKKRLLPPKGEGKVIFNSYYLIFLFPWHYHACLKLSNIIRVWPALYFLSKNMWWPEKFTLWPPLNHSCAFGVCLFVFGVFVFVCFRFILFCILWLYRHGSYMRRWKVKTSFMPPLVSSYFFLHRQNPSECLPFHPDVLLSHRQCDSTGPSTGRVGICCWEMTGRVREGSLFMDNSFWTNQGHWEQHELQLKSSHEQQNTNMFSRELKGMAWGVIFW